MITSEPTRLVPGATGRPSARYFPRPTSHPRLEKRRVTTASRLRRCSLPRRSSRASALAMQRRSTGGGIHLLTRTGDFTKRCQDEKARIDAIRLRAVVRGERASRSIVNRTTALWSTWMVSSLILAGLAIKPLTPSTRGRRFVVSRGSNGSSNIPRSGSIRPKWTLPLTNGRKRT